MNLPASAPMAWINMFIAVVQAALIAVFGFLLKDRLDIAIRERQASVQERQAAVAATERMSRLIDDFEKSADNDQARRKQIAAHLAMFGSDAAIVLFGLAATSKHDPDEAMMGLMLLATQHPGVVCNVMTGGLKVTDLVNNKNVVVLGKARDRACAAAAAAEGKS